MINLLVNFIKPNAGPDYIHFVTQILQKFGNIKENKNKNKGHPPHTHTFTPNVKIKDKIQSTHPNPLICPAS